jgi:hypothetical protein
MTDPRQRIGEEGSPRVWIVAAPRVRSGCGNILGE